MQYRGTEQKRVPIFGRLEKKCFIQVIKWRTVKEPPESEFLDEIYSTVNVFK